MRTLALRAHRKGLELVCHLNPDVPDALIGDSGRLRQVLLNLVGNAIKFTEEGEVEVSVERAGEVGKGDSSFLLRFGVRDTGIGIPREKQLTIFQAFEQGDNSTTRRYEGTGLGLWIASRLVGLMGGEVAVESEPGRGSTFRFTARFGLQPHPPASPARPPLVDLRGLRVLVVDDNATNRLILEEWLRDWQTEPTAVGEGLVALSTLWRAVALGLPYGLVLLDGRMPGIDGPALAAEISRSPQLAGCPLILLTSEDRQGGPARQRGQGIAAVVRKPIRQEELLETVHRVLSRSRPETAAEPDAPGGERDEVAVADPEFPHPLHVLVAEDNELNRQVVEHLLTRKGHSVQIARNGREALEALEHGTFDLLLLDVHMPELDGFRVIEAVRGRERGSDRHLPVVALTARSMKEDRERCLRAGMDEYLAKPIRRQELLAAIERALVGRSSVEPPPPGKAPGADGLLDAATLLRACDADPVLLGRMITVFQADAPDQVGRLGVAVREGNAEAVRESAHKLRGLLSAFSATAAEVALLLEQTAAVGQADRTAMLYENLAGMVGELARLLPRLSVEELKSLRQRTGR
jgi:CheY-like chemotaxis protein